MDTQQSSGPAAFIDVLRMMKQYVLRGARWSMAHDSALFKMTNFLVLDRYPSRGLPVSQRRKNASVARVVQQVVSHLLQCDEQGTSIDLGA